ncbi:MAG: hypothetical protein NWQ88_00630 [Aquiluna sp.]|jgi:hypothetical protein|uniref:hypothetical protein n=1 Tax=Aquiluna sp. TaxID=2053504 RepID=UPI00274F9B48|nr:hypothetical protein [Aquiluna sp.]MDP4886518.1 hypothetical protein [Aquiluna sp.]
MIEFFYLVLVWYSVAVGIALLGAGLFGARPGPVSIMATAGVEAGLLIQLLISIALVVSGQRAQTDTLEFFGYLIVAIIVPLAAGFWGLAERTKYSMMVLGAAALTVAVMLYRMQQLWTGINPLAI